MNWLACKEKRIKSEFHMQYGLISKLIWFILTSLICSSAPKITVAYMCLQLKTDLELCQVFYVNLKIMYYYYYTSAVLFC